MRFVSVINTPNWSGIISCMLCIAVTTESKTVELLGAGASFPSHVYTQWMSAYRHYRLRHVELELHYDSIGSGDGKARIKGEQLPAIHYAGSDSLLTAEELASYPDLTVFPTMAGAIVMAYNIPGIDQLILSLEAIVGIYNGTVRTWNDPLIAALNPGRIIPDNDIVVIVRADNSGTTKAFTSGLSAYSQDWKEKYGTFSSGLDRDTQRALYWDNDVVRYFGNTNRGISGLILSIDYSLAYIAIADAFSSGLDFAKMKNSAGNVVEASVETVQNAISSSNGSFDMIMNRPGDFVYPLSSFTYFIVYMTEMTDCDSAVELVRYVEWFYLSQLAQKEAINLDMVPLDIDSATHIENTVLKVMSCQGKNVWELMLEQIASENTEAADTNWQISTFIGICIVTTITAGVSVHFGRKYFIIHRELLKDTWRIDSSKISLHKELLVEQMKSDSVPPNPAIQTDNCSRFVFREQAWLDQRIIMGAFEDQWITLIRMDKQPIEFTRKEKTTLLWMRDNIRHGHLMQLHALTKLYNVWYTVHPSQIRGSLREILRNEIIEIHIEGIIALAKALIRGLIYLHRKGIIHGRLSGRCCFIDVSWNLRIGEWTEIKLETSERIDVNKVTALPGVSEDEVLLWTAPEVIKFKRTPTEAADVYSLCMVFQEMFSRQDPYYELTLTRSEVINAIISCGIQPRFEIETPMVFRAVMQRAWEMDPESRPKLEGIDNTIKAAFAADISFLDSVIRSVERYAKQLEEKVTDHETGIKKLNEKANRYMYQNVPSSVANILQGGAAYVTQPVDNVCIMLCKVTQMDGLVKHVTPKGIFNLLNTFYAGLDQLLLQLDIYKLNRYAGETLFIVGLQRKVDVVQDKNVALTSAGIAKRIIHFAVKFSKERLVGINTNIMLKISISSGEVTSGIMGNVVPQYIALGRTVEEALELAAVANPNEIRISEGVFTDLKEANGVITRIRNRDGIVFYTIDA